MATVSPLLLLSVLSLAWCVASQPFTQCPPIGNDTSCQYLITFDSNGGGTIMTDTTQGPYDGSDDALVGVLNNAGFPIFSFTISGPGIFGFDSDGLKTFCSNCSNSNDPTGYAGPLNTFNVTNFNSGTVVFPGTGLLPGASTYFSLEGQPTTSSINITSVPTPAPTTAAPTTPPPTTAAPITPSPTTQAPTGTCPPCTCATPGPTTAAPITTTAAPVATTAAPTPTTSGAANPGPCSARCDVYSSLPNRCCNANGATGICCGSSGCGPIQTQPDGTTVATCNP